MKSISLFLLSCVLTSISVADTIFTPEQISQWKNKSFSGETQYKLIDESQLSKPVLKAQSEGSASGLFYEEKIDLNKTPWISWQWKVENFPVINDEKTKPGDDYAARLYIVVKDGWGIWNTKAINYVWSQQQTEDSAWPNPFAGDKAMMVAVENSNDGQWKTEKRNIKADLKRLFGKEFEQINGIAIMTDTDNSESRAVAYYGEIVFSKN